MKNKKIIILIFLFLFSFQFLIGLKYVNLNNREGSEFDNINPKISDIIVGNYTVPGVSGSIPYHQLIRIGLLDDLEHITGDHAWKGALLAAREINEGDGIDIYGNGTNHYIGLVARDTDEANESLIISKGLAAANKMINYDNPHYIIGGYRDESVSAYIEPIMDAQIPFLTTGLSSDSYCENVNNSYNRYKYYFRVMPLNSTSLGTTIIHYIGRLCLNKGITKVAILREDLAWTVTMSNALISNLPVFLGEPIVTEIAVPIDASGSEFNTHWDTIDNAGVQLTIPIFSSSAAITMLQQYRNVKPKCLLVGIDVLAQLDDFWDHTEGACQYEILMQAVHRTAKTSKTIPFWDNFISTYDMDPLFTGVGSYDAVKLLANVSDTLNSFNPNDTVSELENFNKSNPFIGVSANYAFTSSHDLFEGYPYSYSMWCQWNLDGNKVVVPSYVPSADPGYYPSSLATGSIKLPYWGINNLVAAQDIPDTFILNSNAGSPDKDGIFDLTWSSSDGADNYSVFIYDRNIQYVSKRYLLNSYEDKTSPFTISGLTTGDYYCIVAAYNATGERLSNTVYVEIDRRPGNFTLFSDADFPIDTDGTFNLTWSVSEGADNYSIYMHDSFITEINSNITLIENQTAISPFLMSKLKTGEYFFVIQALNAHGERLSNNVYVDVDSRPGNFTLTTDADFPIDTDGTFNLTWSVSEGADNYSIYMHDSFIAEINSNITLIENQTAVSPFLILGLLDGDYFFAVMAYNETGEKLSNNIYIEVRNPPGQFILSTDAEFPDTDGNFNLTWTDSVRATSYSIFQYSEYITVISDSLSLIVGNISATNSSFEITGLDIGFYYYIVQAYNGYNYTESNCIKVNVQFYDEVSGYWELAPFIIDDTGNGHYNWSEVVSLPWCSGSGTEIDPYIIEFIKIDGNDLTSGITIRNSNVFFTIRNSSFFNAGDDENDGAGVKCDNVSYGTLLYLNSSRNNANGIFLGYCQYITITSCSVNKNSLNGISLFNCNNNSIIDNTDTINYNDNNGIHLVGSDNNRIIRNIINNNTENGIFLDDSSDNNYIDWNNLLGNGEAIYNLGQNNFIGTNNIFPSKGTGFPIDMLFIILIISVAIFGTIGAAIIIKKRISLSEKKEKVISEKKKQKVRMKLEAKLRVVDQLIKERQIKLAYKNLGKIKDTADQYDFYAIFNKANEKVEICKDIEAGIYREVKIEEQITPITTKTAKEEKKIIPIIKEPKDIRVFLSFSTIDADRFQISKIVKHLEKFPEIKKVYHYTQDSGQNIVEYMEKTLSVSNIFVLFCTENSKKSRAVEGEWQSAYQLVKKDLMKIIPVYENEDDVPILLIPMLNVKYDKDDFDTFINKLYQEILR